MFSKNKIIIIACCLSIILFGCSSESGIKDISSTNTSAETAIEKNEEKRPTEDLAKKDDEPKTLELSNSPVATLTIKELGEIKVALLPEIAPNTVNNFISLAQSGFYNGLIFHRVINEFMIQGGDPTGTGTGGPGYSIKGEFASNNFDNPISHTTGVISMARSNNPDSAGSQFFIVHKDSQFLDGEYAAFGIVLEGMDIVNKIATTETNAADKPKKDIIIESITIDLKEYQAQEPEKL